MSVGDKAWITEYALNQGKIFEVTIRSKTRSKVDGDEGEMDILFYCSLEANSPPEKVECFDADFVYPDKSSAIAGANIMKAEKIEDLEAEIKRLKGLDFDSQEVAR